MIGTGRIAGDFSREIFRWDFPPIFRWDFPPGGSAGEGGKLTV